MNNGEYIGDKPTSTSQHVGNQHVGKKPIAQRTFTGHIDPFPTIFTHLTPLIDGNMARYKEWYEKYGDAFIREYGQAYFDRCERRFKQELIALLHKPRE